MSCTSSTRAVPPVRLLNPRACPVHARTYLRCSARCSSALARASPVSAPYAYVSSVRPAGLAPPACLRMLCAPVACARLLRMCLLRIRSLHMHLLRAPRMPARALRRPARVHRPSASPAHVPSPRARRMLCAPVACACLLRMLFVRALLACPVRAFPCIRPVAPGCDFLAENDGFAPPKRALRMQSRRNQPFGAAKPEISAIADAKAEKTAKTSRLAAKQERGRERAGAVGGGSGGAVERGARGRRWNGVAERGRPSRCRRAKGKLVQPPLGAVLAEERRGRGRALRTAAVVRRVSYE